MPCTHTQCKPFAECELVRLRAFLFSEVMSGDDSGLHTALNEGKVVF